MPRQLSTHAFRAIGTAALLAAAVCGAGCKSTRKGLPETPAPLGSATVDPWMMKQEEMAEAEDFIFYEHEFQGNTPRLTAGGEDHVRQVASRLTWGSANGDYSPFNVIVERSSMSVKPGTKYRYPVHNDPQLDEHRRLVVAQALAKLGVQNAEEIVFVAPALSPGLTQPEAERAYSIGTAGTGLNGFGGNGGSGGAGFGGIGGGTW